MPASTFEENTSAIDIQSVPRPFMFRGHSQRVVYCQLTSAIDIQSVPRLFRDGCIFLFDERNRHSKSFPRSYAEGCVSLFDECN